MWDRCGLFFQLSLEVITEPLGPCSSIIGSARRFAAGMPKLTRDGPRPRSTTGFDELPRTIKPPIITRSPTSTRRRGGVFQGWAGGGGGVAVGGAVGGGR